MTIEEFTESTNQAFNDYINFQSKWISAMETINIDHQIDLDKCRILVLEENASEFDEEEYEILKEAADDSAFQKFKAGLKRLWEAMVAALRNIKNTIVSFFSKDREANMKKIAASEKGKEKISVPDYAEMKKAEKEYKNSIDGAYAKLKAGKEYDKNELNSAKEKYMKRKKAIMTGAKVTSVAAVIGTLFAIKKKTDKDYDNYQEIYSMPGGDSVMKQYESKWDYFKDIKVHAKFIRVEEAMNDCRFVQFVQKKLHRVGRKSVEVDVNPNILKKNVRESVSLTQEERLLDELIESVAIDKGEGKEELEYQKNDYLESVEDRLFGIDIKNDPERYLRSIERSLLM